MSAMHEISDPVFWENKKNIINLSSAEVAERVFKVNLLIISSFAGDFPFYNDCTDKTTTFEEIACFELSYLQCFRCVYHKKVNTRVGNYDI